MKTQKAFTITELMITVAVIAVIATAVLPNVQFVILNNTITTKTNELIRVISYARSESILNPTNSILIEAINNTNSDNEWGAGWKVGADTNGDNTLADDEVTKVFEFNDSVTVDQLVIYNDDSIIFEEGRIRRISCNNECVFIVCNAEHSLKQEITLRRIGKARTKVCDTNDDCNAGC